ncbi:MAG TPA: YggS family pyridoxal phosphate-dependent enzyme [Candidatus Coproplasma avicola]|uniref:Pyridoxal phosphate homeostasis protein n=1 Tax=Candidatus Coproplasma avicola TaxID=2840744 RepID=A0A9D1E5B2_9FIRM|nr:YggS family pyridoxal phosphate-dependent enzyme [Candidatus Coproplasma avicola]
MIEQNVKNLLSEIPQTNPFGERVTLVAAVKTQTPDDINRAICAGVRAIGDNHVQEFRDKYDLIEGNPERHFIGHLQTNKVKYLIGKIDLYHSVDRMNLAEELSKRSAAAGVVSDILVQINIGNEETKGGFEPEEAEEACARISTLTALNIKGLMAMLPFIDDQTELRRLATMMRDIYDRLMATYPQFEHLSMGMSGDWKLCVECGSNMIRLGTSIFGARHYN